MILRWLMRRKISVYYDGLLLHQLDDIIQHTIYDDDVIHEVCHVSA